jgi:hypothetical protein
MELAADGTLRRRLPIGCARDHETADIYKFSISGNVDDLNRILMA